MPDEEAKTTRDESIAAGTSLVLIRHGEADCNVGQYIGGIKSCRGLTPLGKRQAEVLAERLARTGELDGAVGLWSSVLPRAVETAEILARTLGLTLCSSPSFSEREPGEADGLSWAEFAQRYGRSAIPGDGPDLPLSPGGESWADFVERATDALVDLVVGHPGSLVVVVADGGVIDSSMISFLDLPNYGAKVRLHPDHTSLTEWRHSGQRWRLVRYNDASHLLGPQADDLVSSKPPWLDSV